ncbi:PucR family transcriptional regulator [Anaerobacillus arseniciselenatis]|uniref:PucR family transcriptional regulator n=1 Tax=Anaerobacillus arseniciselenatis TaxID=85682 RepID=A0A1S2L7S3_9BACI|nr:PucR family transcriptional regulator [Anaerobacillus arseniciselenatis]OIJ08528.1 PucR family transcriptional regulator [Anaerobacillus arseniciselenatis]
MNHYPLNKDPFKETFGSLENLVDKISDVLQCPVTIEDANHRLLAYSSHEGQSDKARVDTIIARRVPEKVINSLWRAGIIPKLNQSNDPVRISEINDIGLGDRVATAIVSKNGILGYIWVLEIDKRLSEEQFSLLKQAAQTAKNQLLQVQVRKKKKQEGHQELFWQILTGHLKSHEEIKEKIEQFGLPPSLPASVIIFQFKDEITPKIESHISYMVTTTQQLRITFFVISRHELILLGSPLQGSEDKSATVNFIEDFISQMGKRFKVNNIQGACGSSYDTYEKVEKSYHEAITVLNIKNQFPQEVGDTYSYQQLGIYRYLEVLLKKKQEDGYENATLKKLGEYDGINKTQLLETLEIYLNNDSNVNDAAKELHIHTNTLIYRLKRIVEIADIDLKNPNQKMTLYLDIKLNKLI